MCNGIADVKVCQSKNCKTLFEQFCEFALFCWVPTIPIILSHLSCPNDTIAIMGIGQIRRHIGDANLAGNN